MKLRVFDTIATPPPPKKKLSNIRAGKILFLFNFCRFFFSNSNKRNKMSGNHDRRTQGGRVSARPGGGGA